MTEAEELAERSRVRKSVKKCLKPLNEQRNDFKGCVLAFIPVVVAFGVAMQMGFSGWASGGIAFVVLIIFAAIFGSRDEKEKNQAADKSLDLFDRYFPHGNPRRTIAIEVLKQMAGTEKYDYKEDANRLLKELGIEALPEQSADAVVGKALDQLDDPPTGPPAPAVEEPPGPAPQSRPEPPPRDRAVPIQPEVDSAGAGTSSSAPSSRHRRRHIPLEPEDPGD